jgi:predicted ATPase
MFRQIEALRFRCLKDVQQPLGPFRVLIGPNASGKTTFLDVVTFLGRLVSDGLDAALQDRTNVLDDLLWQHQGNSFELAVEAAIPDDRRNQLSKPEFDTIRYEVQIGRTSAEAEVWILSERVLLKTTSQVPSRRRTLFPEEPVERDTLLSKISKGVRTIVSKTSPGDDHFYSEVLNEAGKGWFPTIRLGPRRSAFGNLPEDESRFPVSTWLKSQLSEGVQSLVLNSLLIRKASPPGQAMRFKPDGSNLPWVIAQLEKDPARLARWVSHVRTALPDLESVRTIERADDKHRYLMLKYAGGLEIPSWMASDGTLRLLALTLPAYLPEFRGVYLIEEPENGINPSAMSAVYQSLSSMYEAQILVATHSPVILGLANPEDILCFRKTDSGATDIVNGQHHPALRDWRGETNLGVLFAGGVL